MSYSLKVMDHYFNPRHAGSIQDLSEHTGTAIVGSTDSAVIQLQILVDEHSQVIKEVKFKTYGCGYSIAASSLLCEWINGMNVEDAIHIDALAIIYELELPPSKYHSAKLAVKAVKFAVKDYRSRNPIKLAS